MREVKDIFIPGSEGKIGRYLMEKLRKIYAESNLIRVVHEDKTNNVQFFKKDKLYRGDLNDKNFVRKIFVENNISHVIYCASYWRGRDCKIIGFYENLIPILNVLEFSNHRIRKMIFLSSSLVYEGSKKNEEWLESFKNLCPPHSYGASKLISENIIKMSSKDCNFKYTIWRLFHTVIPRELYNQGRSRVCTDVAYKIIEEKQNIRFDGLDDESTMTFAWIDDVVDCIVNNLENKRTDDEIFNLGTSEEHTIKELTNEIIIRAKELGFIPENAKCEERKKEVFKNEYFKKIKQSLGWKAKTTFVECIAKFIREKYVDYC